MNNLRAVPFCGMPDSLTPEDAGRVASVAKVLMAQNRFIIRNLFTVSVLRNRAP